MISLTININGTDSKPVEITDILTFDMEIKKNCHSEANITGVISEDIGNELVFRQSDKSIMSISEIADNDVQTLFCGRVNDIELYQEGSLYIVKAEGISFTAMLDVEKKSRSFQDADMTYKELVKQVVADTESADVLFCAADCNIAVPFYQYEETDWAFLKRVASQLETGVLSAAEMPRPQVYFGLPKKTKRYATEYVIDKIWFSKSFYEFYDRRNNVTKRQFLCYDVTAFDKWQVGEQVALSNGQAVTVVAMHCSLKQGLLQYQYTLAMPEVFKTAAYENPRLAGASLAGTVVERESEKVRVWLDIDKAPVSGNAIWYDWVPETGDLFYCMPEVGERVMITFDDSSGNARACSCIRSNGTGHMEMQDNTKRYFTTSADKRLYACPDSLGFVDLKQEIPLKIEINDVEGTSIESNQNIEIAAKGNICLEGGNVSFQAPQEISLVRRGMIDPTVLNMCNGFDCIGQYGEVKMAGTTQVEFPIDHASDTDDYDLSGAETAIMASTPCNAGKTELERFIVGSQVGRIYSSL